MVRPGPAPHAARRHALGRRAVGDLAFRCAECLCLQVLDQLPPRAHVDPVRALPCISRCACVRACARARVRRRRGRLRTRCTSSSFFPVVERPKAASSCLSSGTLSLAASLGSVTAMVFSPAQPTQPQVRTTLFRSLLFSQCPSLSVSFCGPFSLCPSVSLSVLLSLFSRALLCFGRRRAPARPGPTRPQPVKSDATPGDGQKTRLRRDKDKERATASASREGFREARVRAVLTAARAAMANFNYNFIFKYIIIGKRTQRQGRTRPTRLTHHARTTCPRARRTPRAARTQATWASASRACCTSSLTKSVRVAGPRPARTAPHRTTPLIWPARARQSACTRARRPSGLAPHDRRRVWNTHHRGRRAKDQAANMGHSWPGAIPVGRNSLLCAISYCGGFG